MEHGPVGIVGAGQRRRVRGRRPHARVRLADLVDDDRHAGSERLLRHAPEGVGALHVLQQQQQRFGLAFVQDELGDVQGLQAGLVAGGHHVANRQLLGPRVIEEREADAAALGDHRQLRALAALGQQRPVGGLHRRAEGRAQGSGRIGEPHRVGPDHRHAVAPRDDADGLLHFCALASGRLRKARAQHHRRAHAGLAAPLQLVGDVPRRNDQDGKVGGRRADRPPTDRPCSPITSAWLRVMG